MADLLGHLQRAPRDVWGAEAVVPFSSCRRSLPLWGIEAHADGGTVGHAARDRATDLLGRVGLGNRLGFRPDQLSGGEKQRVAVARALANNPTVLLADEPTANLDSGHGREIARLLRRIATEDARSIVIVSHDDRLREVADRVLWLEDGAFRELSGMATDPVCGMAVEPAGNPTTDHDGRTWSFCSIHCRDEFTADPDRFLATAFG